MGGADKDKGIVWKYGKTVNIFMLRVIFFRSPYTSNANLEKSWNTLKRILVYENFVSRNFFRSPYTSNAYLEKSWNTLKRIFVFENFVSRNIFVHRIRLKQIYLKKSPISLKQILVYAKFIDRVMFFVHRICLTHI